MTKHKRGFTLLEVLVVVLIIGILAAVAVPQYQKAVLKSRFSAVMPMAKSVADANEVYYLGKNMYALGQDDLDVTPVTAENTSVKLSGEYQNADENYEYVAAWRTDVPGVRYIQYQKNSPKFASNIHCEADETNEDALWLCEKGLNGTEIPGSINMAEGNYKTFLLAGNIGTDKLPTSLNKLAASLCAGKENCTYTVANNIVAIKDCDTTSNTCVSTSYNTQGEQTQYRRTVCMGGSHLSDGICPVPGAGPCDWGKMTCISPYESTYAENNTLLSTKSCSSYNSSNQGCVIQWERTINTDGSYTVKQTWCRASGATITSEESCSEGTARVDYYSFDAEGNKIN